MYVTAILSASLAAHAPALLGGSSPRGNDIIRHPVAGERCDVVSEVAPRRLKRCPTQVPRCVSQKTVFLNFLRLRYYVFVIIFYDVFDTFFFKVCLKLKLT